MSVSTTPDLVQQSTFIFSGTVVGLNRSSVNVLKPRPGLALVRFEQAFRVNPVLGNLNGRSITVQLVKGTQVQQGQQLIFFGNSWVHADEIAVTETGHIAANRETEREVEQAVASLPQRHLANRVATATLIVTGTVAEIRPAGIYEPVSEHVASWTRAAIEVQQVLKGSARAKERLQIVFPASLDAVWRNYPKLSAHERAVFLLHQSALRQLPQGTLMLTDPADVQPVSEAGAIKAL